MLFHREFQLFIPQPSSIWHEKAVSSKNTERGCYKTKELFPRKMLGGAGIEKACLTQYIRGGWHKVEFAENARQS